MAVFIEPQKWAQTLGKDADVVAIPDTSGETDPSIDKIFPSVFSIPLAQGGRAIPRSVLNGLFKLLGDWTFYQQNGGVPTYSTDFDYVVGRVILYTDNNLYKCIQANGVSSTVVAPDSVSPLGSDYWVQVATLADFANYAKTDLSNIDNTAKIAIAHNAMPSLTVYDDLTLTITSGTSFTAPADGFIYLSAQCSTTATLDIVIASMYRIRGISVNSYNIDLFVPIAKGATYTISYNGVSVFSGHRFVYTVGSESEQ